MKAIYINLDPYLAAFAAWIKAHPLDPETGERATQPPTFNPPPLAVTIPLGTDVGIIVPGGILQGDVNVASAFSVDGIGIFASLDPDLVAIPDPPAGESVVTNDFGPGYTAYANANTVNSVFSVSGESVAQTVYFFDGENDVLLGSIPFTVLVRRETASGPVDLVDFTPPAAAPSAADIKSALVAAGDEALAGVNLNGAWFDDGSLKVLKNEAAALSRVAVTAYDDASGTDILTVLTPGS